MIKFLLERKHSCVQNLHHFISMQPASFCHLSHATRPQTAPTRLLTILALSPFLLAPATAQDANKPTLLKEPTILRTPELERTAPFYPRPDDQALLDGFDREFAGIVQDYAAPKNKASKEELDKIVQEVREGLGVRRDASGKVTGKSIFGTGGFGMNQFVLLLQKIDGIYFRASAEQRTEIVPVLVDCVEHFNTNFTGENLAWGNWANYGAMRPNFPSVYRVIRLAPQEASDSFAEKLFRIQALGFDTPVPDLQMDDLKGSGAEAIRLPAAIRDPQRRLAMVKKAHDYAQRLVLAPFNFSPEGGPMHHTIWHYYYAQYSTGPFFADITRYHRAGWYFSPAVYERIRRIGNAAAFIVAASDNTHPLNGGGRPGLVLGMGGGVVSWLDAAAQTGYEGDPKKYHPRYAAALLYNFPGHPLGKRYVDAGIKPASIPDGHLTMNIGALAAHRRKGWNVTVAGLSPATYKHEIYSWTEYNNYSQYARWGSHIITHPSFSNAKTENGLALSEGFNWAFIPGATCPATPDYRLMVRRAKSYICNGSMSGGCTLGDNGVWGQDQSSGPGAKFRKSAFFFGDRITFLTTNVAAEIPKDATSGEKQIHTTLTQWPISTDSPPLLIDDKSITSQSETISLPLNLMRSVIDSKGNAYVIAPSPTATLVYRRGPQTFHLLRAMYLIDPKVDPIDFHNMKINGKPFTDQNLLDIEKQYKPRTGNYEVAYLQHDLADGSVAAGSAYHLLPMAGKSAADKLKAELQSTNPPCTILQRDQNAHILSDRDTQTTAYVVFSTEPISTPGPLISLSNPGTAMVHQEKDGSLNLALSIPLKRELLDTTILLRGHYTFTPPPGRTFEITHLPDQTTRLRWLKHDYTAINLKLTPVKE